MRPGRIGMGPWHLVSAIAQRVDAGSPRSWLHTPNASRARLAVGVPVSAPDWNEEFSQTTDEEVHHLLAGTRVP